MMLHGDHGAAWRRRQRRLRSWWRHEQQSVAMALMALSAAAHHSFDKVAAGETYYGLRARKTDRAEAVHYAPRRLASRAARGPELFQVFEEELSGGAAATSRARPRSGRLPLPRRSSSCTTRKTLKRGRGQGQSRTLGRRSGCSGTSRSTSSTSCPSRRFSMLLCRRWWTDDGAQVLPSSPSSSGGEGGGLSWPEQNFNSTSVSADL